MVTDGRFDSAGLFDADGTKLGDVQLVAIPETRQIVTLVDKADLGALDLATACYGVAMFGNAEAGEGIGFIRPVYDYDYWNEQPAGFVRDWRFGGGAGEIDFGPEQGHRHPRPERHRHPRRRRSDAGAGDGLAEHITVALPMIPLQ